MPITPPMKKTQSPDTHPASTIAGREGTGKFCFAQFGKPALQAHQGN